MGTLYWQLNDLWPVVSWSSIDYLGNWKALHYEVKKSFENILISTEEKENSLHIYIVNDTFKSINKILSLSLIDFYGKIIYEDQLQVESPENSSKVVFTLPLKSLKFDRKSTVLRVNLGEYEYLHYFSRPKDLKLFENEINPEISGATEIENKNDGFRITLISKTLQKNVYIDADSKGKWSDNYFDLLPNQSKTIYFYTENKALPKLQFKTLNQLIK